MFRPPLTPPLHTPLPDTDSFWRVSKIYTPSLCRRTLPSACRPEVTDAAPPSPRARTPHALFDGTASVVVKVEVSGSCCTRVYYYYTYTLIYSAYKHCGDCHRRRRCLCPPTICTPERCRTPKGYTLYDYVRVIIRPTCLYDFRIHYNFPFIYLHCCYTRVSILFVLRLRMRF